MVQFKGAIINPNPEYEAEDKVWDNQPSWLYSKDYYTHDDYYGKEDKKLSCESPKLKFPDYIEIEFPISHDAVMEILSSMCIDNDEFMVDIFDCSVDFYTPETNNPWTLIESANQAAEFYKGLNIEEDVLVAIMEYFNNKECSKSNYVLENHAYKVVNKPENEKSIPYKGKYIQLYYED